jgi:uncharacterized phage protein (TIGR02218 family)
VSRTVAAPLAAHLATNTHYLCRMILFVLDDGTNIGITDHDQNIDFSLPEVPGVITYRADTGFRISDVQQSINLDPGNYEVFGPIGDSLIVTRTQLLGGRWTGGRAYLFAVNWKAPASALDLMYGEIVNASDQGDEFKFEVLDQRHRLSQTLGRTITNQCRRKKASCCVNIAPETATTVATVTDAMTIEVAAAITSADFIGGRIWFTTGPLAGNDPVEIFAVTGSVLTLYEPLPALPDVGDDCTIKEGCDGTIEMCRDRYDNAINFDGFPAVRGRKIQMPAIPGQGNNN